MSSQLMALMTQCSISNSAISNKTKDDVELITGTHDPFDAHAYS